MMHAENILICIAVPFLASLPFLRREGRHFVAAFLIGMGMCLIAAYVSGFLSSSAVIDENNASVFISPVIEEFMKLLSLLLFIIIVSPKDRMLIMYAVGIGVGFATFENCCYIMTFGAASMTYIAIRGFAAGIMHIVSILSLSLWIVITRRLNVFSFSAAAGGLGAAMIFHALYNLLVSEPGISSIIGYILPVITSVLLYRIYRNRICRR